MRTFCRVVMPAVSLVLLLNSVVHHSAAGRHDLSGAWLCASLWCFCALIAGVYMQLLEDKNEAIEARNAGQFRRLMDRRVLGWGDDGPALPEDDVESIRE